MEKKAALEEDLTELEEIKADANEQEIQLQEMINEYSEKIEDFDDKLSDAKEKASKYQNEIQKQTDSIKALEAEEKRKAEEEAKKKADEEAKKKAQEEAKKKAEEEAKKTGETNPSQTPVSDDTGNKEPSAEPQAEPTEQPQEEPAQEPVQEPVQETEPTPSSTGSAKGQEIANFAVQFVGYPYVAGGTSLTEGADCSGFTMAVYQNFGISLPRTSASQAAVGRGVSYAEAAPGDIIYYGGHVGIYIGNGQIVHASTQATGIKISNALYRSIITVRRIVE